MKYIIMFIIGYIAGSLINAILDGKNRTKPIYDGYIGYIGYFYERRTYVYINMIVASFFSILQMRQYSLMEYFLYYTLLILLVLVTIQDYQTQNISNRLIIYGTGMGLIIVGMIAFIRWDYNVMLNALLGMLFSGIILLVIYFISRGGIGMGDVKLFACTGVFLGLSNVISALILSTVASGLVGITLIIARKKGRNESLPFAPFVLIGVFATMMLG